MIDPATTATKAKTATAVDAKSVKAAKTIGAEDSLAAPHPTMAAKPMMAAAKTEALHSGNYAGKPLMEGGRESLASDQFQAKGYNPQTASKMAKAATA